jgi:hypothetical protein
VSDELPTAPHCDAAILHAPGECQYCDEHPDWQQLRQLWGICYTGHAPVIITEGSGFSYELIACPSDIRRPGSVARHWPGNRPTGGRDD